MEILTIFWISNKTFVEGMWDPNQWYNEVVEWETEVIMSLVERLSY